MTQDIIKRCPFCGREHHIPQEVSEGILCVCGAYGQTDEESDAYMFPFEAAQLLGADEFYADVLLDIRHGGVVLEGDEDDPENIILQWARQKEGV